MKELRKDLAKDTVLQSSEFPLPLPNNFYKKIFTITAMDNFDNANEK